MSSELGPGGHLIELADRLDLFLHDIKAPMSLVYDPLTQMWAGMATWGSEADDSPMAGAAAHGLSSTIPGCIEQMLREAGY